MKRHRTTIFIVAVIVPFMVVAWLASDKDGRNESQREPIGTPLAVELEFVETPVTIVVSELRPITPKEFEEGGFRRWQTLSGIDLDDMRVWVASFDIERDGEGEISPFTIGSTNWNLITVDDERILSSRPWGGSLPCEPIETWRDPAMSSCAYFIVPSAGEVVEVQFTGVDRGRAGRRTLPPLERYVTWTVEP